MPDTATSQNADWSSAVAAALDWWRDAGVDHAFVDDPQDWLADARGIPDAAPAVPLKPLRELAAERSESPQMPKVGDRAAWPQSLDTFAQWWLDEEALSPTGLRRLPPLGGARADLMVLVPMPAADDGNALLSGRAGRLLDAILGTIGLDRAQVYIGSALPAHVPMPDWQALRAAGLGEVLVHHIALAAPKRLLILGTSSISALLGHDPPNLAQSLRAINQDSSPIAAMPAWDLEAMLARPALKAALWSRWLEWTGTDTF
ncbi:MAG: uracil-DNA glycosylase family protein [Novosphingobium sp.]|uniref:uracil-DNA glycosylase family protein n=1 Tax=Novosphingobium sp. TaxID=1874826 RepID=UPI003B9C7399